MLRKILKSVKLKGFITTLFLSMGLFFYAYAPNFIVEIKNPLITFAKNTFEDSPLKNHHDSQQITFETKDHLQLKANYFKMPNAQATVILLHGIRSNKEHWTNIALWLNSQGYNAVALDLRAHGQSNGIYCTYGYYEKQDVSDLVDYLIKNGEQNIGIWGHSLGGAISLQALAKDKRLQFGIIESAYADFNQITKDYSKYYLKFESDWLNDFLLDRAGEMAKFPIDQVNPIDYCPNITQPVLIVHGTKDQKIKPANASEIFSRIKSSEKKLLWIKGAGHTDIHEKGGENYLQEVAHFIEKHNHI
jgi:pimeloyl-ACP methyl ester carboxylesterase